MWRTFFPDRERALWECECSTHNHPKRVTHSARRDWEISVPSMTTSQVVSDRVSMLCKIRNKVLAVGKSEYYSQVWQLKLSWSWEVGYLMQLKHSQYFHKLRCWQSHELEVVGGKKKKKRKNWRKTREVRVKAVTRSPLQSTALEGLQQQKYFKIDLEEYFIKKTI